MLCLTTRGGIGKSVTDLHRVSTIYLKSRVCPGVKQSAFFLSMSIEQTKWVHNIFTAIYKSKTFPRSEIVSAHRVATSALKGSFPRFSMSFYFLVCFSLCFVLPLCGRCCSKDKKNWCTWTSYLPSLVNPPIHNTRSMCLLLLLPIYKKKLKCGKGFLIFFFLNTHSLVLFKMLTMIFIMVLLPNFNLSCQLILNMFVHCFCSYLFSACEYRFACDRAWRV